MEGACCRRDFDRGAGSLLKLVKSTGGHRSLFVSRARHNLLEYGTSMSVFFAAKSGQKQGSPGVKGKVAVLTRAGVE